MTDNAGNPGSVEAEFAEFMSDDGIEIGDKPSGEPTNPAPEDKPKRAKAAPKPAVAAEEDAGDPDPDLDPENLADIGEDDGGEEDDGEDDDQPKQKRKPSDRIRELTRKLRDRDRQLDTIMQTLEKIAPQGLQRENAGGNNTATDNPAPDPSDTDKYPLGHLDDRYIEDKLEWLAEKKATERADAVLQRQQEIEQNTAAERQQEELLVKVDDLTTRGVELYDDFQESVLEAGMKGEWALSQPTFEAAHEAENGAAILYALSQDKAEAKRVANLSPYQQLKYVQEKDAELSGKSKPRTVPRAGNPPQNLPRGANSRTQINPATDDLDDFEKAWKLDEKRSR